jgi:hypothetical protein
MLDGDDVEPQEAPMDQMIDEHVDQVEPEDNESQEAPASREKTMIPLSVAQRLRERKRELELELQWEKQERSRLQQQYSQSQAPKEDDNARYESATREDLSKSQNEIVRIVEEKRWIKENPEAYEIVNERLPQFLKQRPNLASAIDQATNRYEEAYVLMKALSPKQQTQLAKSAAPTARKEAPNSPGGVPKAAALNQAVDVMQMSDSEFTAWRKSQKRR